MYLLHETDNNYTLGGCSNFKVTKIVHLQFAHDLNVSVSYIWIL